jgi:serine phosphatase RsbU (regulator of sigma subunit)
MELFAQRSRVIRYKAGDYVFREGDRAEHFAVILSGEVEVVKVWSSGEVRVLRVLKPGDFIGEMGVFYREHTRTASAWALEAVELLEISPEDLKGLMKRQSNLAVPLMQEAIDRFRQTEQAALEELLEKNRLLAQSIIELKAAQEQLIQKEKIEHELAMARQIQENFLPHEFPALAGWDLAVFWKPAHQVSGDFYDFFGLPSGQMAVIVGDVTGKGVPAALVMAVSRSVIRATLRRGGTAGALLGEINNLLVDEMPAGMFVTAFLALLDPQTGEIQFANAGHCLPLRCTSRGTLELRARGMPLGLLANMAYEENQVAIEAGESVLFYSDALLESHDPQREIFGMPRLHQAAGLAGKELCAQDTIQRLVLQQQEFTGPDAEQEDDLTIIVLRREQRV